MRGDIVTFVCDAVRGADVLDVGCADHSANREATQRWMHKHIAGSARSVVGLDLLESEVARLRERGYNVVAGDAITADLGRTFDFVVAGEIIEHVDNAGGLLRNLRRHLRPGGQLILTTPNAFFGLHWMEWLFLNSKLRDRWNEEHVAWYDPFVLGNLIERCGLGFDALYYFSRSRRTLALLRAIHLPCPRLLATSIAVIAHRRD